MGCKLLSGVSGLVARNFLLKENLQIESEVTSHCGVIIPVLQYSSNRICIITIDIYMSYKYGRSIKIFGG